MYRLLFPQQRAHSLITCCLIHYIFIIVLILTTARTSCRCFVRACWQQQQQQQQLQRRRQPPLPLASNRNCFLSMTSSSGDNSPFSLSLADFLQQTRLDTARQYVIGNQAGDADSIVSAIALAYIDSMAAAAAAAATEENSKKNPSTPVVVPIVSVAQKDFKLRQETVRLLELVGVVNWETSLHFVDQLQRLEDNSTTITTTAINISSNDNVVVNQPKTVILVDHNRLDITNVHDERQHWRVVEILDHHYDEGMYLNEVTGVHRNIAYQDNTALVGSTCTLVTERLLSQQQQRLLPPPYPADLALMLLGVIILDTVNMSPDAGKGTLRDQQAMDALLEQTDWTTLTSINNNNNKNHETIQQILSQHVGGTSLRPNLSRLFDLMQSAKFDPIFWKSLSAYDALRLDYKQFTAAATNNNNNVVFGVSTVLMPLDDFLSKDDLIPTFRRYIKGEEEDQPIVVLGVMSAFSNQDGNLERELLLCSLQQEDDMALLNSLTNYLVNDTTLELSETPYPRRLQEDSSSSSCSSIVTVRRFRQANAKASRKQVVPFMLQFFETTAR